MQFCRVLMNVLVANICTQKKKKNPQMYFNIKFFDENVFLCYSGTFYSHKSGYIKNKIHLITIQHHTSSFPPFPFPYSNKKEINKQSQFKCFDLCRIGVFRYCPSPSRKKKGIYLYINKPDKIVSSIKKKLFVE